MRGIYHLKRKLLLCVCTASCIFMGNGIRTDAAPVRNLPRTLEQPDGTTIECFVSGDEYFHYLHDMDGNMIMKNEDTGEYVYAKIENGEPTVSESRATRNIAAENPMLRYILKQEKGNVTEKITYEDIPEEYLDEVYESSPLYQSAVEQGMSLDQSRGEHRFKDKTVNNLVIFIDFEDQKFNGNYGPAHYNGLLNTNADSLKNWFAEASYGHAEVISSMYPKAQGTVVAAYHDKHNCARYIGIPIEGETGEFTYKDENGEDITRVRLEQELLSSAISEVKKEIPKSLDLDANGDGLVDSITFVVAGQNSAWNGILWSHKWYFQKLSDTEEIVSINGIQANEYTFIMEEELISGSRPVGVLAHEMFHLYGAPDLYHHYNTKNPVGNWDIMSKSKGQMPCVYMRYKYGGWIEEIPEIKKNGRYTLNKASMSNGNCYCIRSTFSVNEYFVLEFRKREGVFEKRESGVIPGTGLVIYKIDTRATGNSQHDGKTNFNEVAITNHQPDEKYYPYAGTSVSLKLRDKKDSGIIIKDITLAGDQVSFNVEIVPQKAGGYFPDLRVAQIIAEMLKKDVMSLTDADLLKVTELNIPPVKDYVLPIDLEGVEKLTNLQKLTANGCKIEDISYLNSLKQLTDLDLRNNNIKTVAALAGLTNVKQLYLRGNLIDDYTPIKPYYNQLTEKDFSFQKLGDITIRGYTCNSEGSYDTLTANITNTIPEQIYLKYEKYTDDGKLIQTKEVHTAEPLKEDLVTWVVPDEFRVTDGYVVVNGYERADFKQLCAKAIIYPTKFSF